ncbi:polysaccharide biosynthesis/export family protein [Arachidicoccus soli]|uniref:Sugar transporter n=1 Tax=Arachidicoccus soli TaxID=2341117 RepID=A0A386HQE4_9BACT|nr:polysaccharide biosynthesis/export family protein [Arachidicoccus soli]AYD47993.1 sugar transporter [Arachidicoccus soli]
MDKKTLWRSTVLILTVTLMFSSCATKRNLVYFSNLSDSTAYTEAIQNQIQPKIEVGDALAIKVTTLNPQSNILYNSGSVPLTSSSMNNTASAALPTSGAPGNATLAEGYVVDNEGNINFPLLGKIALSGLTIDEAQQKMTDLISKTDKGVIVNISIQNYKVTVIGEVTRPGSFTVPNDKVNVLEALGMAGDMTPYAVRENVLVIREKNGQRTMQRLNLTDKNVFKSPFFYLQQNDVVYVQPENKLKAAQADTRYVRLIPIITAAISALAIVLTRVL